MTFYSDSCLAGPLRSRRHTFAPMILLLVVLAGCQPAPAPATTQPPPTTVAALATTPPQAAASPTPAPTALPAPATAMPATAAPTNTSAPTSTVPAATAVPAPVATAVPAPTATPVPVRPTPSPTRPAGQTAGALATAGQQVYPICAGCHGANGEGGFGPALIGSANQLAQYGNARALFDFIRQNMPQSAPGSLTQQQYLEVTAFLLQRNNLVQPDAVLSPENLATIPLGR